MKTNNASIPTSEGLLENYFCVSGEEISQRSLRVPVGQPQSPRGENLDKPPGYSRTVPTSINLPAPATPSSANPAANKTFSPPSSILRIRGRRPPAQKKRRGPRCNGGDKEKTNKKRQGQAMPSDAPRIGGHSRLAAGFAGCRGVWCRVAAEPV